jgi:peptidoglycan hydrolase-like protein with peptidoglycan-binding domain
MDPRYSYHRRASRALVASLLLALVATALPQATGRVATAANPWPNYGQGSGGENVRSIELMLRHRGFGGFTIDDHFGSGTASAVRRFQAAKGLAQTGVVNDATWRKLIVTTRVGSDGRAVRALQRQLNQQGAGLAVDGDFGPATEGAVDHYLRRRCMRMDGKADVGMWNSLVRNREGRSSCYGSLPKPSFGPIIERLARYRPQTTCDPTAKPGVLAFRRLILRNFPTTASSGITRDCDVGGTSEHKEGRAWDWRVFASDAADRQKVRAVFAWLFARDPDDHRYARLRRLGIMYMIWNERIWSSHRAADGWRPYSCSGDTSCHRDHVHFSFSWKGARKNTTWWNREDSYPDCWPQCI